MRFRSESLTEEQTTDEPQVPEPNRVQIQKQITESGHHSKAKTGKSYAKLQGSEIPPTSRGMAATKAGKDVIDPVYHPIKRLINAIRDSSGIRVRVVFEDGTSQLVDLERLNDVARKQYNAQGIVPQDGPCLRRK
jgi:hypothetical protein